MPDDTGGKLPGWILVHASAVLGVVLVACAFLHRRTLGAPGYYSSWLVPVELALIVALGLILQVQLVLAVVHVVRQRWKGLWILGITMAIYATAWIGAMILDAPALQPWNPFVAR